MTDTWLQTLDSGQLDLVNPRPEQVNLRHIAKVLSRIPRFGGHTAWGVLSVAQHCLEGARAMRRDGCSELAQAAFLLHDAHEAYMGDITTPVARALADIARVCEPDFAIGVRGAIKSLKSRLDRAIYTAAGLPWPLPSDVAALVKHYDLRMCRTERDARMDTPPAAWESAVEDAEPIEGCNLSPCRAGRVAAIYGETLRTLLVDNRPAEE